MPNKLRLLFLTFLSWMILEGSLYAADSIPEVGKPLPDFFLDNVKHYKSTFVNKEEFLGRWLFLDFWFTGCTSCIRSFPKMSKLQEVFKDKAQFLLIGINENKHFYGNGIEPFFERLRIKQELNLAIAFDSVLNFRWQIWAMPHIIIVSPEGIVHSITSGINLTEEKIKQLIEGKSVSFALKNSMSADFRADDVKGNDSSILLRTLLTKWKGERQLVSPALYEGTLTKPEFTIVKVPLEALYNIAYIGLWQWQRYDSLYSIFYPQPVLEILDSSNFSYDFLANNGFYNYQIITKDLNRSKEKIMKIMQTDLRNIFGYDVVIETREMPVWKLVVKAGTDKLLKSRFKKFFYSAGEGAKSAAGFKLRNGSIDYLMEILLQYTVDSSMPFFNETNIEYNIDISMDILMTDRERVIKELQKNGLDLIKEFRQMKVLVIKDSKNQDQFP